MLHTSLPGYSIEGGAPISCSPCLPDLTTLKRFTYKFLRYKAYNTLCINLEQLNITLVNRFCRVAVIVLLGTDLSSHDIFKNEKETNGNTF